MSSSRFTLSKPRQILLVLVVAVLAVLGFASTASAATHPSVSTTGSYSWTADQSFANGTFTLTESGSKTVVLKYQGDGNLVEYVNGIHEWDTKTANRGHSLVLQGDSNIVIKDASGKPIWNAASAFKPAWFHAAGSTINKTVWFYKLTGKNALSETVANQKDSQDLWRVLTA